jgi:hypothetical protein
MCAAFACAAVALGAQDYHPPRQVAGVKPCPNLHGTRTFTEAGRPVVEIQVKMNVDVDGAPNAYGPKGKKTLDILKHAYAPAESGRPGEVVGFMTEYDGGPPTVQGPHDPYPGYYVSQTDFADKENPRKEDPRRYVDASRVNYVVQGGVARRSGVQLGDFVRVYSCRTGRTAWAIVGDSGNESGAEGSLALVRALGYDIRNGVEDSVDDREIVVDYFPGSNPRKEFFKTQAALDQAVARMGLKQ